MKKMSVAFNREI